MLILLYAIFFLIAGASLCKILHFAIQPSQALDILFGWQKMLNSLFESDNKSMNFIGKALGDCEMCMSFWFSFIWTFLFFVSMLEMDMWGNHIVFSITFLLSFHALSTILSVYFITKLFNKKK